MRCRKPLRRRRCEASPIADFESHYRDGLMRRLRRASSDMPARARFDRTELLSALHRHRTPEPLAHALAEDAAKAQLTDMTLGAGHRDRQAHDRRRRSI